MNHKQRFKEIYDFLLPYQRIWQNEIMLLYPDPLADYPLDWIKELACFRDKSDVIKLEKKEVFEFIKNPTLIDFYRTIEKLSALPSIPDYPPMPVGPFTFLYMIPKKQYEIKRLAPLVHAFYRANQIERIIDIGGGIGLLAQSLVNQYDLRVTSLDMDPQLQKTGRERHEKNARIPTNRVDYQLIKVDENTPEFVALLDPQQMSLGLHTCGPLANSQIRASVRRGLQGIVNFGCCYQKLEHVTNGQNISSFAQSLSDKLEMNHFALTLACRAHRKMSDKDYDLKLKVKLYRYSIHMLLHDHYGHKELITLGNSSPKLYDESFGTYALEQLSRVNIKSLHSKKELDDYFDDPKRQDQLWDMLAAGLIRNALGRLLELYILLDRVIYLEENDYEVELQEFFDEETSPRNIGIVAKKKGGLLSSL